MKEQKTVIRALIMCLIVALTITRSHGQRLSENVRVLSLNNDTLVCVSLGSPAATMDYWAWKGIESAQVIDVAERRINNLLAQSMLRDSITTTLSSMSYALNQQLIASEAQNVILSQNLKAYQTAFNQCRTDEMHLQLEYEATKQRLKRNRWKKWEWLAGGIAGGVLIGLIIQ